jgi:hypothetical protein
MPSPATCLTAEADIAAAEAALWAQGFDAAKLADYQGAHRKLEALITASGYDRRHKFVVVIPVADRPQQLATCLDSLMQLCRAYGYGGMRYGRWRKVAVVIAEDSADPAHIANNRALAEQVTVLGLATHHFGPDEQAALLASLDESERAALTHVLGDIGPGYRGYKGHKGQGVMRNLAYLHLARMQRDEPEERLIFWSIDSDQEFSVKVGTASGDVEACAVSFFHRLDEIFDRTDALVLTGKVVGDPPVSPAVMAGNFLADVIGFLESTAKAQPQVACTHHDRDAHREGEAAYHDMADRFGFRPASEAYRYPCPLAGPHSEADCFDHFAARLNGFFYGEHPTRISRYVHDDLWRTVQPARTVYAGNYAFRPEGLRFAIPFAALRLRMSGPTLGRLVKSQIGSRFVSANLPMLHKRTVTGTAQSEFRSGVAKAAARIDLCGEFERQFFGDVMLFSIERLTADGFPTRRTVMTDSLATIDDVRADLLSQYNAKRTDILNNVERLRALLDDAAAWWNAPSHADAAGNFRSFVDNIAHNFGDDSACRERINSDSNWQRWRSDLAVALQRYPDDAQAWSAAIDRHA